MKRKKRGVYDEESERWIWKRDTSQQPKNTEYIDIEKEAHDIESENIVIWRFKIMFQHVMISMNVFVM